MTRTIRLGLLALLTSCSTPKAVTKTKAKKVYKKSPQYVALVTKEGTKACKEMGAQVEKIVHLKNFSEVTRTNGITFNGWHHK